MFWELNFAEIIVIASVVVNLGLIILMCFLYVKVGHLAEAGGAAARLEKHARSRLSRKTSDALSRQVNEVVGNIGKRLQQELEGVVSDFSREASVKMQSLAQNIAQQEESVLKESQVIVAKIVNDAKVEADNYKKRQMEGAAKNVYDVVIQASKQVIGKTINPGEHQKLVEEALERAKRDKFFS